MPDPTVTPDGEGTAPEGLPTQQDLSAGVSDGSSTLESGATQLPEEYQPYKDVVPWAEIPDYLREECLKGVKKFHGEMSRGQQEAAQLRQEVSGMQERVRVLDQLAADPRFVDWWNSTYNGHPSQTQQAAQAPASGKLKEYLDTEGLTELQGLVEARVKEATAPLLQQIQSLSQTAITDRTSREIDTLKAKIKEQGWPELDPVRMGNMRDLMTSGRAVTAEDAYRIACSDDLVKSAVERAIQQRDQTIKSQAAVTFPPGGAPSVPPTSSDVYGDGLSETQKLVQESKAELTRQGINPFQ